MVRVLAHLVAVVFSVAAGVVEDSARLLPVVQGDHVRQGSTGVAQVGVMTIASERVI